VNHLKLKSIGRHLSAWLAVLFAAASVAFAQQASTYKQTNIISDGAVPALVTDSKFVDPWGISIGQEFWINTNVTGFDYVNDASGNIAFKVTIPSASGTGTGSPTGTVVTTGAPVGSFMLADGHPALFLFCSLDGTISGWDVSLSGTGNVADIAVNNSANHAVYTDIALDTNATGAFLLATNFGAGASVEVYDTSFHTAHLSGSFSDPNLPTGYAPYAVHTIGNKVYVTYMLRDTTTYTETLGSGTGVVDAYDLTGVLIKRAITGGNLNAPWGMALAPAGFGIYGGDLLVGNFGDGVINVYDPATYAYLGQVADASGNVIANPGLWEIVFGQASPAVGDPNTLYFAAGLNQEKDGLFGSIAAVVASPGAGTFALSASTGALTVTSNGSVTAAVSLAPSNGFTGTVQFACSGLPAGAACTFSPSTLSVTGTASAQTTMTIATSATYPPTGYMVRLAVPDRRGGAGIAAATITPLAALLLFGAFRQRRRFLSLLHLMLLAAAVAAGIAGCGGSSYGGGSTPTPTPTPSGTSQITITATSGAISRSTMIALTVH
jgi:uncharacterized protein (TIGR03118 family)